MSIFFCSCSEHRILHPKAPTKIEFKEKNRLFMSFSCWNWLYKQGKFREFVTLPHFFLFWLSIRLHEDSIFVGDKSTVVQHLSIFKLSTARSLKIDIQFIFIRTPLMNIHHHSDLHGLLLSPLLDFQTTLKPRITQLSCVLILLRA